MEGWGIIGFRKIRVDLEYAKRCVVMSKRASVVFGGTIAILCAATALSLIVLAGIRIGDRAFYKYSLEPLSRAEQRCEGLVPPVPAGTPEWRKCVLAELRRIEEPVWKGILPLLLAALLASMTAVGGLAIATKGSEVERRERHR